jgi:hypothetical protein
MKEEFKKLYDYIINSGDEEKMHVLGKVTCGLMERMIETSPQTAREYIDQLQAVKWYNYVTPYEADQIVIKMTPKPSWNYTEWSRMMSKLELELKMSEEPYYNECALYVTMCMISSDSGSTIAGLMNDNGISLDSIVMFKFIYRLAIDKLKDGDRMFSIRSYFRL